MDPFEAAGEKFYSWLERKEGVYLSPKIGLWDYRPQNQGRGLIALEVIDKDELLFSIPETVVLSASTSKLKDLLPELQRLDEWMSLILVMLYENSQEKSPWRDYFDILPETFDTPMFWTDEELAELKGTETFPRIGKESAEERYTSILLPVITSHSDLFDISKCDLTAFHRMGSLVMAYSFGRDSEDDDDNSEEEEKNDIAMVPLADILNADPRLNNARLFQGGTGWEMRSIKPIPKDEQIYNTYGNLPNSDLLRRYGYVIPDSADDLVEISTDSIVETINRHSAEEMRRRLDLLEDEDLIEEAYEIPYTGEIPRELFLLCQLLMKDIFEIEQNAIVIREPDLNAIVLTLLAKRMDQYPQSMEEDESLLKTELGIRHRMAIEVRLGEKRILQRAREKVNSWVAALPAHYATGFKRRRIDED